ncbi:MAG: hypothetical protein J2P48_09940 [Alphaproteobacteria bacterium]|nr:hypothetical protein [Alphaproteobacteria bacterium]
MKMVSMRNGFTICALVALSGALSVVSNQGWFGADAAAAATPQQKTQGRKDLDVVMASLRSVDTAYASGNVAEAQTKFEEARSAWNKVAPAISAREAREAQLMFDSLGKKLQASAPAKEVKSTVSGMLEELREDIVRELR